MYIPIIIKIVSAIHRLIDGDTYTDTQTHIPRQQDDLINLLLFFKIQKLC
jgi:hypothetical protein